MLAMFDDFLNEEYDTHKTCGLWEHVGCGSICHFPDTPAQSKLQSENCEYSQYQNIPNFALKFTLRRRVGEMTYAPTAWAIVHGNIRKCYLIIR